MSGSFASNACLKSPCLRLPHSMSSLYCVIMISQIPEGEFCSKIFSLLSLKCRKCYYIWLPVTSSWRVLPSATDPRDEPLLNYHRRLGVELLLLKFSTTSSVHCGVSLTDDDPLPLHFPKQPESITENSHVNSSLMTQILDIIPSTRAWSQNQLQFRSNYLIVWIYQDNYLLTCLVYLQFIYPFPASRHCIFIN